MPTLAGDSPRLVTYMGIIGMIIPIALPIKNVDKAIGHTLLSILLNEDTVEVGGGLLVQLRLKQTFINGCSYFAVIVKYSVLYLIE